MSDTVPAEPPVARSRGWLLIVGCAIGLGFFAVLQINGCERTRALDNARYEDCREGNIPNAYIRLVLERSPGFNVKRLGIPDPNRALPILSCQETADAKHPIRLVPAQERRYLEIFSRGRLPVVRHGRVVGAEPLPAPRRRH